MRPHLATSIEPPAFGQTQVARQDAVPFLGCKDSNGAPERKLLRSPPRHGHNFAGLRELSADFDQAYDRLFRIWEGVDLQVRSLDARMPLREHLYGLLVGLRDRVRLCRGN